MNIPKSLGTMDDLLKRWKMAQGVYGDFETIHRDAFEYSAPNREGFTQRSPGQKRTQQIYDDTATNALPQFGNRIQSALMPAWAEWLEFKAGSDIPENETAEADEALEKITKLFFSELNQSNFYTELAPALIDLGVGTGAILLEEEEMGKGAMIKFTCIPLHELYPEAGTGSVDSAWRKQKIAPKNILRTWPQAVLPQVLLEASEQEDAQDVEILNAMLYCKDGLYHQVVIHEATKTLLFTQAFKTKRLIVFRWSATSGEVYGRGPIINILPSIKVANKIMEMMMQNGALQISGVYTAVDDGVFNPYTARIQAGTILPVASNSNTNPSLRQLDRSGDLGFADYLLTNLQEGIKKALFVGQLGEITDPTKTATEMMIRQQEQLKENGANFGRLKSELINPLVDSITDIMRTRGKFPEYKVDGKIIAIRHQSPIAKSEMLEDYQSLQMWLGNMLQYATLEDLNIAIRMEDIPEEGRKLLGIKSSLMRTDEEREQMIQQRQQMMQQQAMEAQGGQPQPV